MSRPGESRLGRWARLKAEARAAEREAAPVEPPIAAPVAPPAAQAQALAPAEAPAPVEAERAEEKPLELPPLESLTEKSDFSLFMRGGVPDDARKAALRKLWSVDSHFAQIDISECHSIDFNAVPTVPDGLKNTIYRVGSGMVEAVEEIERLEREAAEKARLAAAAGTDSDRSSTDSVSEGPAPDENVPPTGKA